MATYIQQLFRPSSAIDPNCDYSYQPCHERSTFLDFFLKQFFFSSKITLEDWPVLNASSAPFFVFENWADGTALVQMIIVGAEKLHQHRLQPPELPRDLSWKNFELHFGQSWKNCQNFGLFY